MKKDFNALTEARLEQLEERVDRAERIVLVLWFTVFIKLLTDSAMFSKVAESLAQHIKRK